MFPETYLLKLNTYNLSLIIVVISAFLTLYFLCKKLNVDYNYYKFISINGAISLIVGLFSATIFQSLYNKIDSNSNIVGGATFLGGLLGGAIFFFVACYLCRNKYDGKLSDVISILPCAVLIGHFFGRIGCFLEGCCYGTQTNSFLGVQFPNLENKVHPTQLYEATFLLILFVVLLFLLLKYKFNYNLSLYLISYGIFRFLIEFLRGDERGAFIKGISPSQFWSIIMIVIGVVLIIISIVNKKKSIKFN